MPWAWSPSVWCGLRIHCVNFQTIVLLNRSKLTQPVIVVTVVVVRFFLGVDPALGAAVLLITRTLEPQNLYKEVDWGLLVLFVGLFVIMGGAENTGLTAHLLDVAQHWSLQHTGVFTLSIAALCNLVNNVPAVMLLKSLPPALSHAHKAWLVLAIASPLAENLTITGSVASIIVVETAKPEVEIEFRDYVRAGSVDHDFDFVCGLAVVDVDGVSIGLLAVGFWLLPRRRPQRVPEITEKKNPEKMHEGEEYGDRA